MTVALLLSCDSFEAFFGGVLGLDRAAYIDTYRNDWAWYYASGLKQNGIEPVLYLPSLHSDGLYPTSAGFGVRFLKLAAWFRVIAPFRRAVRVTRLSLYLYERLNAQAMLKSLRRAIVADDATVLYVQEYWSGRFDHLLDRVTVPIAAADHGAVAACSFTGRKGKTLRKAELLFCQTPRECDLVKRYGGTPVLHPNGVDTSYFRPPAGEVHRRKNIVTVARLNDKHKRTSDLIRAMAHLSPDWTLDIVGTGPDQKMLQALADQVGVTDRVTFHGFRSKPDVRAMLQACGVYAMPSGHEAICLAMLEAMACGAAVVGSRIGAFEAMIADGVNGRLFPVADVPQLSRCIEDAWERREAFGAAAVQTVEEHFHAATLYRKLARCMRASVAAHRSGTSWNLAGRVSS